MILIFITLLLLVLYVGLIFYYSAGWRALVNVRSKHAVTNGAFISVIIAARDEEKHLPALLKSLANQTYSKENFEVIVVDDHSTDRTSGIVSDFPLSNLKLIKLADHIQDNINSYKKKAIEVAISQSRGELIVTTDADCITQPRWLETIAAFYENKKQPSMIIMPVVIERANSLIGIFQNLDFMTLQGVTGGAVQQGLHAMCNGANLAYSRKAFNAVNGFEGIDGLASGDDMLLMDKIQRHQPGSIAYLKSEDVIVSTGSMATFRDFLHQRIRWASKTSQYKQKSILVSAGIVYLFNVALLLLFITGLIDNKAYDFAGFSSTTLSAFLVILMGKILVEIYFLLPVAKFFKQESQLFYFPFIQPIHILYTILAGGLGSIGNYEWKGRKVK